MLNLDDTIRLLGSKIYEAEQAGLRPMAVVFSESHLAQIQDDSAEYTTFFGLPVETVADGDDEPSVRAE